MGQPDLLPLVRRAEEINEALAELRESVKEAKDVALGSDDGTDPASGDAFGAFDGILAALADARPPLWRAQETLAAIEGYRQFRAAGVAL